MPDLRLHDAAVDLQQLPSRLIIHDAAIDLVAAPVVKELRMHEAGVTFGPPPIGQGGWFVRVGGNWVKHTVSARVVGEWQ